MKTDVVQTAPPEQPATYRTGIARLSVFLCGLTFLIVAVGGTVKSKEAGLSIPEPFYIKWDEGWWTMAGRCWEYGHRALVGILGIGVATLAAWILFVEPRRTVRRLGVAAVVGVLLQAFLGYLTVKYFAHAPTSIPHAVLGQMMLGVMVCLVVMTSKRWIDAPPPMTDTDRVSLRRLAIYALHAFFVQLLLGAALRHDDQGLALREGRESVFLWHLGAHILGALAVLFYAGRMIFRICDKYEGVKELIRPAYLMMALLTAQIGLGVAAAALKVGTLDQYALPPQTRVTTASFHQATGAFLLALCVFMWMYARRHTVPTASVAAPPMTDPALARASA